MALICSMYVTLRNGNKYRRPDGRPICWEGKDEKVEKVEKEETATFSEESNGLSL